MPCRCDHMEPTAREKESVKVIDFLRELDLLSTNTGTYGNTKQLDYHTAMLCDFCRSNNVNGFSLELQIWWRDHMAADKKRIKREQLEAQIQKEKNIAMTKLTAHEKDILGL